MKRAYVLSFLLLIFLFLSGICALLYSTDAMAGETEKDITVMLYMCGSNLESDTGAASRDLKEILRSRYDSEKVNVIAMTGGSKKWWSGLDADETAVYDLAGKRPTKVYADGILDMGESSTLTQFLDFGYQNYPAQRYALIIWDHGAGPLGGVCLDYLSNGDALNMPELKSALSDSFVSEKKLDWIGFDACLMASVETACILEPYADYMIASEETEPGEGWNYAFLKSIHEDQDGRDTALRIIDDYFSDSGDGYITLSCIDLSKMDAVIEKMNSFFTEIARKLSADSFPVFSGICQAARSYGRVGTDSQSYDLVDLYSLTEGYSSQDKDKAEELLQALDEAVVYNKCSGEGSNGLSVYHPYYNKDTFRFSWRAAYASLSVCDGYTRYLNRFSTIWLGEPITDWEDLAEAEITVEPAADQTNTVQLQLSSEQAQQYVTGQVIVLEENEEGYHQVCTSDEVTLTEEGCITADLTTQKLYAADEEGNTLAGPISYDIQDGSYQITACCLNIAAQQMISVKMVCSRIETESAQNQIKSDTEKNQTEADRAQNQIEAESAQNGTEAESAQDRTEADKAQNKIDDRIMQLRIDSIFVYDSLLDNYTNRMDLNWMEYDCIFFPEYYKEETYDTVLKAYQDWKLTGCSMKQNIFTGTDWHFELRDEESAGDLYVTVQVTDTQVNTLSSQPVAIE